MDVPNLRMIIPPRRYLYGGGSAKATGYPLTGRRRPEGSSDPEVRAKQLFPILEHKILGFRLRYGEFHFTVKGFKRLSQAKNAEQEVIDSIADIADSTVLGGRAENVKRLILELTTRCQK